VSFADAHIGTIVGVNGTILRTIDDGASWLLQPVGTISDLNAVAFADANTGTIVGDAGTILRTTDGGATWTLQSTGWNYSRLQAISLTGAETATAVGDFQNIILRTTDGGATWQPQISSSNRALLGVFFIDANTGWAVGEAGTILHTTTGGEPRSTFLAKKR
jgi:photosystem II stability/assembly factor-like uncharacterized protein